MHIRFIRHINRSPRKISLDQQVYRVSRAISDFHSVLYPAELVRDSERFSNNCIAIGNHSIYHDPVHMARNVINHSTLLIFDFLVRSSCTRFGKKFNSTLDGIARLNRSIPVL
ncbi:UDP-3-O-[3-hydroxymyristoyl] glucosamine N-acyltransferase [Trichinella spiralis]|uniref:UDP-3-O-[3-hydroxymyristoyl] glucosamine N-acyltransferase n=1 Tax=Trichinella spiralis TaxID=6334 RepID=UPI0001EFC4C3|nr:UDP-3-O-[3-hydroxymyristoyl] glucosamine N-acyltransferase [Trichinella spiralis]